MRERTSALTCAAPRVRRLRVMATPSSHVLTRGMDRVSILPHSCELTSEEEKREAYVVLCRLWSLSVRPPERAHNPAANPTSIERGTLETLATQRYLVSHKVDGVRFLLLMYRSPASGAPVALLIDRRLKMWEIMVVAPLEAYDQGTLLDGELAWRLRAHEHAQAERVYSAFDAVCVYGKCVVDEPYHARLNALANLLLLSPAQVKDVESHAAAAVQAALHDTASCGPIFDMLTEQRKVAALPLGGARFVLEPKRAVPAQHVRMLCADGSNGLSTDGLVFTPDDAPVRTCTAHDTFKWKKRHTIDLLVQFSDKAADHVRFFVSKHRSAETEDVTEVAISGCCLCLEDESDNVLVNEQRRLAVAQGQPVRVLLECSVRVTGEHARLYPVKVRNDKNEANTLLTCARTIGNVREAITKEDIFKACERHHALSDYGAPTRDAARAVDPVGGCARVL